MPLADTPLPIGGYLQQDSIFDIILGVAMFSAVQRSETVTGVGRDWIAESRRLITVGRLTLTLLTLLIAGLVAASGKVPHAVGERPNVLFIAVDDLRTNLGCYGDNFAKTPAIDGLAARGVVFKRAYCQQAVCNPSRASVMTGRRPDTTKVWDLETHFREALPEVVTLPEHFKKHGYSAHAIGKIYHDPEWAQDERSWSGPEELVVTKREGKYALKESLPDKGGKGTATERADVADDDYIDGQVSQAAIRKLRELKDRPFFLAVGFRRPHLPFSAPEKYWKLYDGVKFPVPEGADAIKGVPKVALHNATELRGYTDVPSTGTLSGEQIQRLKHGYYACTSFMDAQVGKVLQELDRLEITSRTIVVLWSDHGYHLGEKGLWCKTTNFELDTRVPLIIADPRLQEKSSSTSALVELVDLYPTLTELADLPSAEGVEGVSLVPVLKDQEARVKEAAFSQFPRPFPSKSGPEVVGYSVRTEDFRYTEWRGVKNSEVVAREFYDHRSDPDETINRVDDKAYAVDAARLKNLLGGR